MPVCFFGNSHCSDASAKCRSKAHGQTLKIVHAPWNAGAWESYKIMDENPHGYCNYRLDKCTPGYDVLLHPSTSQFADALLLEQSALHSPIEEFSGATPLQPLTGIVCTVLLWRTPALFLLSFAGSLLPTWKRECHASSSFGGQPFNWHWGFRGTNWGQLKNQSPSSEKIMCCYTTRSWYILPPHCVLDCFGTSSIHMVMAFPHHPHLSNHTSGFHASSAIVQIRKFTSNLRVQGCQLVLEKRVRYAETLDKKCQTKHAKKCQEMPSTSKSCLEKVPVGPLESWSALQCLEQHYPLPRMKIPL